MDITRRNLAGLALGAGGLSLGNAQANIAGTTGSPHPRGVCLTVKELTAEERAERDRLYMEQTAAEMRFGQYMEEIRKKYGEGPGVNVRFEERYVFIYDHRADLAAKQTTANQCPAPPPADWPREYPG